MIEIPELHIFLDPDTEPEFFANQELTAHPFDLYFFDWDPRVIFPSVVAVERPDEDRCRFYIECRPVARWKTRQEGVWREVFQTADGTAFLAESDDATGIRELISWQRAA